MVKALKEIIFAERELESAKIELALKSDFNIVDAFKMMDIRAAGSISQNDFKEGLMRNLGYMDFTNDDMYLLFRRFDKANQGIISFNEFNRIMLPFSREYANLVTDRAEYYSRRSRDGSSYFNQDTRYEMQAFWSVMLKTERSMEALRMRLKSRPYLHLRDIFETFTRSRAGLILASDLRDALAEHGFYSTERELQGLLYRLDRD